MKRLQNNIVRRLSVALVLLMTIGIASSFAQDTRQKKKVTTTTTTTHKQTSTPKTTQKKSSSSSNKNTTTTKPSTSSSNNNSIMTVQVGNISFRMIKVEGGTFMMGATPEQGSDADDDEKPTHSVTLSSYYIGETEVTQELWQEVMGTTLCQQRDKIDPSWLLFGEGANFPMYYVSWEDCQDFIRCLNQRTGKNFRLPTEAEWEYAARGGRKSNGYKYAGGSSVDDVAWYDKNSGKTTHSVAQKRANELGLYDMSGNVNEWCSDWRGSYNSSSQTNPSGPSSGSNYVGRGGGWYTNAWFCRVSHRGGAKPSFRDPILGLRLAL